MKIAAHRIRFAAFAQIALIAAVGLSMLLLPSVAFAQAKMTLEISPEQSTEFPVVFNAVFTNREGKDITYWAPWGLDCPPASLFRARLECSDRVSREVLVFHPNIFSGSGHVITIRDGETRKFPFLLTLVPSEGSPLVCRYLIREHHGRLPPGEYTLKLTWKLTSSGKERRAKNRLIDGESTKVAFKVLDDRTVCEKREAELRNEALFPTSMSGALDWCMVTDAKFEEWMKMLESQKDDEVRKAARKIDRCTDVEDERLDKILRCLIPGLEDPEHVEENSSRAWIMISILNGNRSIASARALMRLAAGQISEERRLKAFGRLSHFPYPEVDAFLESQFESGSPEVAFAAACSLASRGRTKGLDLLALHARNTESPRRYEAVEALCSLRKVPEAKAILQGLRNDPDLDVRGMAEYALKQEGSGSETR